LIAAIVLSHLSEKDLLYCSDILLFGLLSAYFLVHLLSVHQNRQLHRADFHPFRDRHRPFLYCNHLSDSDTIAGHHLMKLSVEAEAEVET
jgi:hypothetical protein